MSKMNKLVCKIYFFRFAYFKYSQNIAVLQLVSVMTVVFQLRQLTC